MTHSPRDSAESLDPAELEELADLDSGLRPVHAPRGVWSETVPRGAAAAPPPIPKATPVRSIRALLEQAHAQDPDDYGGEAIKPMGEVLPSERLDIDGLVADLSTRPPPPRLSSGPWEIPSIGPSKRVSLPPPAFEPRARTFSIASLVGVAVAAYLLGLLTPPLVRWMDAAPARVETASTTPVTIEEPTPAAPVEAIEAPTVEIAPAVEAVATEAPSAETPPVVAPVAQPVVARPLAPIAAPRAVVQRPVAQPIASPRTDVEPAPVEAAEPPPVASDLPESPSREAIQAAIESVRPTIQACADPASRGQLARVRFTFAGEGRTAHALVEGVTGPTASCVARAARGVRVPAFSRDRFVVEFPFQL